MILTVLVDGDGRPVSSAMWPGNTADVTTLIPVIDRLHRRFAIARVCVVADRGMISTETVAELKARRLLYIVGVRECSDKLVRELDERFRSSNHIMRPCRLVGPCVNDGIAVEIIYGGHEAILSSCLDATRMWRRTERASLEKKSSMRLSQEPCWV
jgi:transposase